MGSAAVYLPTPSAAVYLPTPSEMCQRNPQGDWEYKLEGCDSVKLTVNPLDDVFNWVVTCSIPQGNTMESKLEMDADAGFTLVEFNCSNNETAKNAEVEAEFKAFLEKGITRLVNTGNILKVTAGGVQKEFTLKKQEPFKEVPPTALLLGDIPPLTELNLDHLKE